MSNRRTIQVVFGFVILLFSAIQAFAAIQPGSGRAWLVIGSRDNPATAISVARSMTANFRDVHVFRSNNGWYAITLGWMSTGPGNAYKNQLVSQGLIPGDSYFHNGQRFISMEWSTTGITGSSRQQIIAATAIGGLSQDQGTPDQNGNDYASPRPGYVTGLNTSGDNFLSMRSKPSTRGRELARLRSNTPVDVLGENGGWYRVRLSGGQGGWVYGKYIAFGSVAPPEPELVVDTSENGLELEVSGLARSGDSYLSLRTGPGTSNRELARLRSKTRLTVTGKADGWYRVRYNNNVEGWVFAKYVSPFEIPVLGPEPGQNSDPNQDVASNDNDAEDKTPESPKPEDPTITETDGDADKGTIPDEKRVALVLGNSAYKHTVELPNPKNDADKIAERLKKLGFEVIVGLDGDKSAMELSIREFVRILPNSDVALFFYAGHAMQVNGANYLIPVDAKLQDSTAVDFETINLASILSFIDEPGRISIALLDACRDNPLSRSFAKTLGPSRSAFLGRGLASPVTGGGNILIGFATAPGEVALDGEGENSPFTNALLNHISTPDVEIELMLKKVKAEVFETTGGRQAPWHNSGLRKEFYFKR